MATENYDVLLVGGGIIGLSLAWELAQHGAKVCVVDRGKMGEESSWAASGMLPPGPPENLWPMLSARDQLAGLSHQLHPVWHERLREATSVDTGIRRSGSLYLDSEITPLCTKWADLGVEHERLDSRALTDLEPALRSKLQAAFLPGESQLRPPWHLRALIAACQSTGVVLQSHTTAVGFERSSNKVVAVTTPTGKIHCGQVCLTSGAWTARLARELQLEIPIRPIRGQILLLATQPNLIRRIVNVGHCYLTPRPDGRMLVGSTLEDAGFSSEVTAGGLAELAAFAVDLCPALATATVETSWAGLRPESADGWPHLGKLPGLENAWIAAGHFRAGIQLSPATAVVMRSLLMGQEPPVDLGALGLEGQEH